MTQHVLPFLCDFEFNGQGIEMVLRYATRNSTQFAENLFLESLGLTNFLCRKPTVTKIINLDHIFLYLVDTTDDDTISIFHFDWPTNPSFIIVTGASLIQSCKRMLVSWVMSHYTGKVLDYCLKNSKGLLSFNSGTRRSNAPLIPITSSCMRTYSVRKYADAEAGNGNVIHQNGVHNPNNANGNVPYENGVLNWPNNENGIHGPNGNGDGGNSGDDGGNGGNDGGNGGNGNAVVPFRPMFCWYPPIAIHRITVSFDNGGTISRSPIIYTNIFASQYHSWTGISGAIHQIWLGLDGDDDDNSNNNNNGNVHPVYTPFNCWPGCLVYFGGYEGDIFRQYHWVLHRWEDVKELVTVVVVLKHHYELEG